MFLNVLRFELAYRFRRPMIYFLSAFFLIMTMSAIGSDSMQIGGAVGNSARNSPFEIVRLLSTMGAMGLLVLTGFVATAINRDREYRIHELFMSTPVTKGAYLNGRFAGSLIAATVAVGASAVGIMLGAMMPWLDPERILPFNLWPYVYTMLVFVVPNLFIVGAFLFSFSTLTRRVAFTWVAMFAILVGWAVSQTFLSDLESLRVAALVDPFGIGAFQSVTRYWTVVERNTMLPPLQGVLLLNRAIWLAAGFGTLAFTRLAYRMGVAPGSGSRRRGTAVTAVQAGEDVPIPSVSLAYDARARFRQWLEQTRSDMVGVLRSVPFLLIMFFGIVNIITNLTMRSGGSVPYPLTRVAVDRIDGGFGIFLFVVLLIYSGQLVWRERSSRTAEITDALPTPNWIPLTSKFAALAAICVIALSAAVLTAVVHQAANGYFNFELGVYLRGVFGVQLTWWLIVAALMLAVHVLVNNRILGYVILLAYYVVVDAFPSMGIDHHLLLYGEAPDPIYSDMNGLGFYAQPIVWFRLYWGLITAALVVAAAAFWSRGTDVRGRGRLAEARRRIGRPLATALTALVVAAAATGSFIYYNTNVLNEWMNAHEEGDLAALYETTYKQYEDEPQPRVTDVSVEVDFYPERRRVDVRGEFQVVNPWPAQSVERVLVNVPDELELASLEIPGTKLETNDDELRFRIYAFDEPLEPGDSASIRWEGAIVSRGFRDRDFNVSVAENGTFLDNDRLMPFLGYESGLELTSRHERRKRGLPEVEPWPDPDDPNGMMRTLTDDGDWVTYEAILSTSSDQTALTTGDLVRQWDEGERSYFHYRAPDPILHFYPYVSGRYAVARGEWEGVDIEIYHHPQHDYNVDRMIEAVSASLETYSEEWGPYQNDHLRIVEFPRYRRFAQSFSGLVPFSESANFVEDLREERSIDMVSFITAHEVAHQWWGHQVAAAWNRGATFIEEGMAQYSALLVMERDAGSEWMERFLRYELDHYLTGRGEAREDELPLVYVENQSYIHYYKGSLALYALRDYLGEDRLNEALRGFVDRHRFRGPPYPTSLEFVEALEEAAQGRYAYLVDDLCQSITLYDNRLEAVEVEETDDGRYRLTLAVQSRKLRSDGRGVETEVEHEDWIEVGAFGEAEDGDDDRPLLLEKRRLTSGENTIELVLDERPVRAGIDPRHILIDRVPEDNTRRVAG